ncbi:hypothetical protein PMI16_04227 [Herbaspirillum sp. CF444]|uniref:Ig-like domain-containing protein n=1 Tax=Herbaspirillum sp. CF444 TaxID=1144319 RepID=UPI0002724098|nr:Ig-like domain-containing protein [Herbaspirillum sp. CF444]EJL83517.1 hypothetical protein PMI16_04227 [Herbaspirillum sp. CF444]
MSLYHTFIVVVLATLSLQVAADNTTCTGSPGEVAACEMTRAYNDTPAYCGDQTDGKSGIQCSGVLIRGTAVPGSSSHTIWESKTNRGMSFSFLRKDSNFTELAFASSMGIIFYPPEKTPLGKNKAKVLCGFPFDGDTVNRPDMCGQNSEGGAASALCDTLTPPIKTAGDWVKKFLHDDVPAGDRPASSAHSCGFTFQRNEIALFQALIGARNQTIDSVPLSQQATYVKAENEIVLDHWDNDPKVMPIQAFFYVAEPSNRGLAGAKVAQQQFYLSSGRSIVVPIVQVALPASNAGSAQFSFNPKDQIDKNLIIDEVQSHLTSAPAEIEGNGVSSSQLVLTAKNAAGQPLTGLAKYLGYGLSTPYRGTEQTFDQFSESPIEERQPGVYASELRAHMCATTPVTIRPTLLNALGNSSAVGDLKTLVTVRAMQPSDNVGQILDLAHTTFTVTPATLKETDGVKLTLVIKNKYDQAVSGMEQRLSLAISANPPTAAKQIGSLTPFFQDSKQPGVYTSLMSVYVTPTTGSFTMTLTPRIDCTPLEQLKASVTADPASQE